MTYQKGAIWFILEDIIFEFETLIIEFVCLMNYYSNFMVSF